MNVGIFLQNLITCLILNSIISVKCSTWASSVEVAEFMDGWEAKLFVNSLLILEKNWSLTIYKSTIGNQTIPQPQNRWGLPVLYV